MIDILCRENLRLSWAQLATMDTTPVVIGEALPHPAQLHDRSHHPAAVKAQVPFEGHSHLAQHHEALRSSTKRDRDSFGDGADPILLEVDEDSDGSKKVKLENIGLEDDSMLDDLKPSLVMGDGMATTLHTLGMGVQYFAHTGNIKSPIFEGIPSLTPEWLLKKVWLKVNGDLEQTVLASLISKDMGPKLRQEIRAFLEKRGEIQTGNRINLKNTIMQAVEITITCQKEKPTLTIVRDTNKQRPKKDGKLEKNFNIGLTPYGQGVCMAELQLKKRDSYTQRSPSKLGLGLSGMGLGLSLGDSTGLSPLNVNVNVVPTTPSPTLPQSPLSTPPGHALAMSMGLWKPNISVKDVSDELLKRNVQVGDLSGQLITMKDEVQMMKDECHKKDMIIAELRNIIIELKPSYPLPPHLLASAPPHLLATPAPTSHLLGTAPVSSPSPHLLTPTDGVNMIDPHHSMHTHHAHHSHSLPQTHSIPHPLPLPHPLPHSHAHTLPHPLVHPLPQPHPHSQAHNHPHPHPHQHAHLQQMHQASDHTALLHMVDHQQLINETMMAQAHDPQTYMPQ